MHLDIEAALVCFLDAIRRREGADFQISQSYNPIPDSVDSVRMASILPVQMACRATVYRAILVIRAIFGSDCGPYGPGIDWNLLGHFRTEPSKVAGFCRSCRCTGMP